MLAITKPKIVIIIIAALFFNVGFFASINGVLLSYFSTHFKMSYLMASTITFTFFIAYFIMSMPFGWFAHQFGYRKCLQASLMIGIIGCISFTFAIHYNLFWLLLLSLFLIATFVTGVEVAVNPLVDSMGAANNSSQRLTTVHFLDSVGTVIGPQFAAFIFFYSHSVIEINIKTILLYLLLAGILTAFWFLISSFLRESAPAITIKATENVTTNSISLWRHPPLLMGLLAIFVYVGCEVSVASFLIAFAMQPEIAALKPGHAAIWLSVYWSGQMLGRLLGSVILSKVKPCVLLAICGALATTLLLIAINLQGHIALYLVAAVGLANSIMYPTIFSLAVRGLNNLKAKASGLLHMGIIGGAIIPLLQGYLADQQNVTLSYLLPAILYSYIIYYAWSIFRMSNTKLQQSSFNK